MAKHKKTRFHWLYQIATGDNDIMNSVMDVIYYIFYSYVKARKAWYCSCLLFLSSYDQITTTEQYLKIMITKQNIFAGRHIHYSGKQLDFTYYRIPKICLLFIICQSWKLWFIYQPGCFNYGEIMLLWLKACSVCNLLYINLFVHSTDKYWYSRLKHLLLTYYPLFRVK